MRVYFITKHHENWLKQHIRQKSKIKDFTLCECFISVNNLYKICCMLSKKAVIVAPLTLDDTLQWVNDNNVNLLKSINTSIFLSKDTLFEILNEK